MGYAAISFEVIFSLALNGLVKKSFHDIPVEKAEGNSRM